MSASQDGTIQNAQPQQPTRSCREILSDESTRRALQVVGVVCSGAVIALSVIAFLGTFAGIPDPRDVILFLYQILFGLLMAGAELKITKVMKWFRFLSTYTGLGFFYVFVGVFTMANGKWYQFLGGGVVIALGLCYIAMGKFKFERGVNVEQIEAQERERVIRYQPANSSDAVMETPVVHVPVSQAANAAKQHLSEPPTYGNYETQNPFEQQSNGRSAYS